MTRFLYEVVGGRYPTVDLVESVPENVVELSYLVGVPTSESLV